MIGSGGRKKERKKERTNERKNEPTNGRLKYIITIKNQVNKKKRQEHQRIERKKRQKERKTARNKKKRKDKKRQEHKRIERKKEPEASSELTRDLRANDGGMNSTSSVRRQGTLGTVARSHGKNISMKWS